MSSALLSLPEFLARWEASGAAERANYQLFLSELCDQLGVPRPEPTVPDDAQNAYVFERSVTFTNADGTVSPGRIDLYRRGCSVLKAKNERLGAGLPRRRFAMLPGDREPATRTGEHGGEVMETRSAAE